MRPWSLTTCATFIALGSASLASAQTETVTLEYTAISGCPGRESFEREVRARTPKAAFVRTDAGRTFRVALEHAAEGFSGKLVIVDGDGVESMRRIAGEHCADVVSALALVAALAVDPEASTAPRSELPLETPRPPVPLPAPAPRAPRAEAEPTRLAIALGAGAGLLAGPAPEPLFVAGPSVTLSREGGAWKPSLRLGLLAAQTGVVGPSGERARFRYLAARLELCPERIEVAGSAELRACLVTDAGLLHARGRDVLVEESRTRAWLSIGLGLGADFFVSDDVSLGLLLAETANVTRDRFVFERPDVLVHEVPIASVSGLAFASWHFR